MENKIIFGVTALFDTPNDIIKAAKAVSAEYKRYDIHSSYPVHGMPKAMKLKPSRIGYFTLVFGLSGTALALLLMWWTMSVDYPLIIGGKPAFALPAFIPITFELTVLLASVLTVATLLFYFFKLPNISHPLHDTGYIDKVSKDKFGVCIEAKDEKFDESSVKSFLESIGGKEITTVFYNELELGSKRRIFQPKFIIFLCIMFIFTSGATYFALNKLNYMAPMTFMDRQFRDNAQSQSTFFRDGFGMRQPVEGTVSQDEMPYPYKDNPDLAGKYLINPLESTRYNLKLGQEKFNIYCSPCHGYYAKGDSRLHGQFPSPPTLHSDKVRDWSDGRIFHVITEGQNIMPSYSKQVSPEERWAIILYIRALQRALNAKEEDTK